MTPLNEVDGPLKGLPKRWKAKGEPQSIRRACDRQTHAEAKRSKQVYGSVPGVRRTGATR
jgi:hypothetical protein